MRVQTTHLDESCEESARRLRGLLRLADYAVVDSRPDYKVRLRASASEHVEVDSIDCELERHVVNEIAHLSPRHVLLMRSSAAVRSDAEIEIGIPADEASRDAVERGVLRGLDRATKRASTPVSRRPSKKVLVAIIAAAALLVVLLVVAAISARAQGVTPKPSPAPTTPVIKPESALKIRDRQYLQAKVLLRMRELEREYERLNRQSSDLSADIGRLAQSACDEAKADCPKTYLLDLDDLQFKPRKETTGNAPPKH
jgi:hypothetical protein